MGPEIAGELIPIFGMITGMVMTLGIIFGLVQLTRGPVGQALARRIQGRAAETDGEVRLELAELRDQVDALRGTLEETQERLDFTERLLSQARPADRLPER
jgi:ubiquinone biosynthesis protein UbiJ